MIWRVFMWMDVLLYYVYVGNGDIKFESMEELLIFK